MEIRSHPGHGCLKEAFFFNRQLDFFVFPLKVFTVTFGGREAILR